MPDPSDELTRRLRAEADRLDELAPPIATSAARSAPQATTSNRHWLPTAAAVVVLVGIGAAWLLLSGDDDAEQLIVPAGSTTTTTPGTITTEPESTVDWDSLPEMGIAITAPGQPMRLLDLDGNDLGTVSEPTATLDGPSIDLPTLTTPEPIDPAGIPEGCTAAFGGGGVRVALCGDDPLLARRIEVVDATGEHRTVAGATALTDPVGHWRWALPSPDGRWVLTQWSDECELPPAFVTSTEPDYLGDGSGAVHLGVTDLGTTSRGLGWTPDGRAIVELPAGACDNTTAASDPGVYLYEPEGGTPIVDQTPVVELTDPAERAFVWRFSPPANVPERVLLRALDELGLEACCGEPSHGGPDADRGAVYEGAEIGIRGAASDGTSDEVLQSFPLLHGEASIVQLPDGPLPSTAVRFDCGTYTWTLSWYDEGTPEVDSMLLLAEELVPHLYCTLPPR